MKRRTILSVVVALFVMSTVLAGCTSKIEKSGITVENAAEASSGGAEGATGESAETVEEEQDVADENGVLVEHYGSDAIKMYFSENEADSYDEYYSLDIYEDKAIFTDEIVYSESNSTLTRLVGTCEKTDYGFDFRFLETYGEERRVISVENGKIVAVENVYAGADTKEIAGTYVCENSEYGRLELTIDEKSTAVLISDTFELTGSVMKYDEKWEVTASNYDTVTDANDEVYMDIITTLEGDKFTYISYNEARYGEYEGDITAFGDLGDVVFHFANDGTVTADIKIQGTLRSFAGNYYFDSDLRQITDCSMRDIDGFGLDVWFTEVDGRMNYSGSYSIPLSAG